MADKHPVVPPQDLVRHDANMSAMSHAASSDEIIKNMLANHMFENFEVGTYKSLIAMTHKVGMPDAEPILRSSLIEETNMARWVFDHIQPVTLTFLSRVEQDELQPAGDVG